MKKRQSQIPSYEAVSLKMSSPKLVGQRKIRPNAFGRAISIYGSFGPPIANQKTHLKSNFKLNNEGANFRYIKTHGTELCGKCEGKSFAREMKSVRKACFHATKIRANNTTKYFNFLPPAVERPFRIEFKTDANEVTADLAAPNTDEEKDAPGGIIGFNLNFLQQAC